MADDFIPDSQFKPDSAPMQNVATTPQFIPDEQFQSDEDKYSTPGQQLKTFGESAARISTAGISSGIERAIGVEPEDIRAREEANPVASFGGSVAGVVGSAMALPFEGMAGLMGAAGVGGAKLLGLGAAEGIGAKLGSMAVKGAIESAIFQGTNEVSKMLLSDPNQTIGTAAADIGLAGLIGAPIAVGVGAATSGTKALWNATAGKKLGPVLDAITGSLEGKSTPVPESQYQLGTLGEELNKPKSNTTDIKEAYERLGVKPTTATISESPVIQNMEANLSQRPTLFGTKVQNEYKDVFDTLKKKGQETLYDATPMSEAKLGREIKDGMHAKFDAELKPIEAKYEEITPFLKEIPISDLQKADATSAIMGQDVVQIAPKSKAASLANSLSEEIAGLKNVDQVKKYRTLINKRLDAAYRTGGEELPVLQEAKNQLTKMREVAINDAAAIAGTPEGIPVDVIKSLQEADSAYGAYKKKLGQFGVEAGLGNVGNARSMLQKFAKVSDESLVKKIFDPNDINQLQFFKNNFPEQFDLARRSFKREIYDASVNHAMGKNGAFDPGKFLNQTRKLSPEALDVLFNGNQRQIIQDMETAYQSIPGNPNPSGTAAALSHANLFSAQGVLQNLSDTAKYGFLKAWPHIQELVQQAGGTPSAELAAMKMLSSGQTATNPSAFNTMVKTIAQVIKGESLINKATGAMFEAGKTVLPSHLIPDDKKKEKLDKKLKDLQVNANSLYNVGDDLGHYMPEHQTALAQTTSTAVGYLNSLRPDLVKKAPLDGQPIESSMQKAQFSRALEIAEQPMVVLQSVKNGTVTAQDVIHLKSLYPGLYPRLVNKLQHGMIEAVHNEVHIPYKTRLGMSLFMGQPLDSTMTPQGIVAAQPKPQERMQKAQANGELNTTQGRALNKLPADSMTPQQSREARRSRA